MNILGILIAVGLFAFGVWQVINLVKDIKNINARKKALAESKANAENK